MSLISQTLKFHQPLTGWREVDRSIMKIGYCTLSEKTIELKSLISPRSINHFNKYKKRWQNVKKRDVIDKRY